MKTRKKHFRHFITVSVLLLALTALLWLRAERIGGSYAGSDPRILAFAKEHSLKPSDWPSELVKLLEKNPETEEYVLNYPLLKDRQQDIDLSELTGTGSVPLLLQWDTRWGYQKYGSGMIGQTGCGPVCLSMVCLFLLEDPSLDPAALARFSTRNGYCVPGSGTSWTLISEGGKKLGLEVEEIPLVKGIIFDHLEAGDPIICVMGPGDFTDEGHYIVLTGCEDGLLRVNDPNSPLRSQTLWDYDAIESQFRNLWVCKVPK